MSASVAFVARARVGWVEERNPAFYNSVKHDDINPVRDWKYSSVHHGVAYGVDPMDWATHNNHGIDMAFE